MTKTTAKTKDGYDKLTAEEKTKWDAAWKKKSDDRDAFDALDMAAAYYLTMTAEAKTVFDAERLKWKKDTFELCKKDPKAIACRKAKELRESATEARANAKYYTLSKAERDEQDLL